MSKLKKTFIILPVLILTIIVMPIHGFAKIIAGFGNFLIITIENIVDLVIKQLDLNKISWEDICNTQ